MKKLSEVAHIVGVTRRTLQEYEKVGLLPPTDKTKSGYWLYDDAAIQKLMLIQIFVEGGYKRKDIKKILNLSQPDFLREYDVLIRSLEEKKKRIDGMIETLKIVRLVFSLPRSTINAFNSVDMASIYQGKSFVYCLNDIITQFSETNNVELNIESDGFKQGYLFFLHLLAIGFHNNAPIESLEVQLCVKAFFDFVMKQADINIDDYELTNENESDISENMAEIVMEILEDAELQKAIESGCGNGAVQYIINSIRGFRYSSSLTT